MMLGRPRDWHVVPRQLCVHFKLGRRKFQRIMRELVAAGYARKRYRQNKINKQWDGSEYDIYGMPQREKPRRIKKMASRETRFGILQKQASQDTQTNRLLRTNEEV